MLSRSTLLALVQYIHSNKDRSIVVATNGLEEIPSEQSSTANEHTRRNGSDLYQDNTTAERD
jgi:hypothetical protein